MRSIIKKLNLLPRIRLPNLRETARELPILGGFIMVMVGLWGIDYRLALIIGGVWLIIPPKPRRS